MDLSQYILALKARRKAFTIVLAVTVFTAILVALVMPKRYDATATILIEQQEMPPDLVRYSFEALGAWAQERQLGREVDETPIEFANRIAEATPELREHAKRLGVLYARVLYARGALPPSFRAAVENFWQRLDEVPARAPSQDSLQPS